MIPNSSRPSVDSLQEWPLAVFTTLAVMGAGLMSTPLLARIVAGTPAAAAGVVPWGALLLAAGLAVSLAHLGRPLRAPLAAIGLGRSRLSAEVVSAGVALALGIAAAALPYVSPVLDLVTAFAALTFLVTLGLVYSLPGQQTWRGPVVWMPLSSGLGFGAVALAGQWGGSVVAVGAVAVLVLAADTALLVVRRLALAWPPAGFAPAHPSLFARRDLVLALRLLLVDIVPGICLFGGLPKGAAGLLALGIFVDRLSFYGFAGQRTTESEVRRVEGLIAEG
jgi:DMSO reductase anchor subunit